MNRKEFIEMADGRLKLVRTEYDCTQEKMAVILGLSKKTVVEIEKGRSSLGWTGAVALCSICGDSQILQDAFGGETSDIISALAFQEIQVKAPKTMGGKVWWRTIGEETTKSGEPVRVQQNILSAHYRVLDREDRRLCASFDKAKIEQYLK